MKIIGLMVIILGCSIGVIAQKHFDVFCPEISVFGPSGEVAPKEELSYSVSVEGWGSENKLEYVWSLSRGKILSGQGTAHILVAFDGVGASHTVTVDIKGLPQECKSSASEVYSVDPPPLSTLIDDYGLSALEEERARIDNFVIYLRNDPTARGYVLVELEGEPQRSSVISRLKLIYKYSNAEVREIYSRMLIHIAVTGNWRKRLFLVPPGAEPPECSSDCTWMPVKKLK